MQIELDQKQYNELLDLVEIFQDCYVENKEVTCFSDIEKIIDERVSIELLDKVEKAEICKQLRESFEWLEDLNISTNIINILLSSLA